jgi:hypothetical protein
MADIIPFPRRKELAAAREGARGGEDEAPEVAAAFGEDEGHAAEDEPVDLLTAVDVAIRDLREISARWEEEASRRQAAECLAMLERAFHAAV